MSYITSSDLNKYKTQVYIIEGVFALLILLLIILIGYLYYSLRKLQTSIKALDPITLYKKVGPSLYVKRPQRDVVSISSSFKHYNTEQEEENTNVVRPGSSTNAGGTLDKNFFTRNSFAFEENDNSWNSSDRRGREKSELETLEALRKLDKVLY